MKRDDAPAPFEPLSELGKPRCPRILLALVGATFGAVLGFLFWGLR